jgi:hypothetical protein
MSSVDPGPGDLTAGNGVPPVVDHLPVRFQRVESGFLAVVTAVAFVHLGYSWWWLLALFLVFDLSMVGYVGSPRLGAWTYNLVHSYLAPAALGVAAVIDDARWAAFLSLVWAFHIAVDRLLGYGLKFQDRFEHTHLGRIGRDPGDAEQGT